MITIKAVQAAAAASIVAVASVALALGGQLVAAQHAATAAAAETGAPTHTKTNPIAPAHPKTNGDISKFVQAVSGNPETVATLQGYVTVVQCAGGVVIFAGSGGVEYESAAADCSDMAVNVIAPRFMTLLECQSKYGWDVCTGAIKSREKVFVPSNRPDKTGSPLIPISGPDPSSGGPGEYLRLPSVCSGHGSDVVAGHDECAPGQPVCWRATSDEHSHVWGRPDCGPQSGIDPGSRCYDSSGRLLYDQYDPEYTLYGCGHAQPPCPHVVSAAWQRGQASGCGSSPIEPGPGLGKTPTDGHPDCPPYPGMNPHSTGCPGQDGTPPPPPPRSGSGDCQTHTWGLHSDCAGMPGQPGHDGSPAQNGPSCRFDTISTRSHDCPNPTNPQPPNPGDRQVPASQNGQPSDGSAPATPPGYAEQRRPDGPATSASPVACHGSNGSCPAADPSRTAAVSPPTAPSTAPPDPANKAVVRAPTQSGPASTVSAPVTTVEPVVPSLSPPTQQRVPTSTGNTSSNPTSGASTSVVKPAPAARVVVKPVPPPSTVVTVAPAAPTVPVCPATQHWDKVVKKCLAGPPPVTP